MMTCTVVLSLPAQCLGLRTLQKSTFNRIPSKTKLTFATASDIAEEMALVAVANAWELAFETDVTFPPVDTAREFAMLLVSPF